MLAGIHLIIFNLAFCKPTAKVLKYTILSLLVFYSDGWVTTFRRGIGLPAPSSEPICSMLGIKLLLNKFGVFQAEDGESILFRNTGNTYQTARCYRTSE
jgi:hypothetical protein